MRTLTDQERELVSRFAAKLGVSERAQVLDDLKNALLTVLTPDGSRGLFQIAGYIRPPYRGQHTFGVEGKMLDADNVELSVLLHADENGRLLEIEFIRWDSKDLVGPQWDTLTLA